MGEIKNIIRDHINRMKAEEEVIETDKHKFTVYGPPTDVEPAEHELEADAVSTKRLQKGLRRLLKGRDLASTTIGQLRSELETLLELEAGALADRSQELKN